MSPNHAAATVATPPLPSYWLVDVDEEKARAQALYMEATRASSPPPETPARRKKVYRPPLVGSLPRDFLRISSSADPWDESANIGRRPSPRSSYSTRRSTVNYDYRHLEDEQSMHEGPPPSYAVAVGRRYSERSVSKTDRSNYRSPQHTYLGVFRTTTMPPHHPPSPRRSSVRVFRSILGKGGG